MAHKIILASQSPRRKQLLEMAEIKFEILIADVDETNPPGMQILLCYWIITSWASRKMQLMP